MKKYLIAFNVALAALFIAAASHARDARQVDTVVELYTSQGCSSCPPADKLMSKLTENPSVLGLSLPVTYWDYIGWKDTLASALNDARQANYRDKMNERYVYTPQMIVGGTEHFVGSSKELLASHLNDFAGHARKIALDWNFTDDGIEVTLPKSAVTATLWQMDLDRAKQVAIGRGENSGKSVTYHNVVRKIESLGRWNGDARTLKLALDPMLTEGRDACAILVQEHEFGPIIAALIIDL
jgi:hypothetical protein